LKRRRATICRFSHSRRGAARRQCWCRTAGDTRFTSAFWTGLHAALGTSPLIFGSPHYWHNTTSKVERVNGVIADMPPPHSGRRLQWPDFVPLVEFAINDSASGSLGLDTEAIGL
jgi:hypothetical protein